MGDDIMSFLNKTLPHFNVLTAKDYERFVNTPPTENTDAIIAVSGITLAYIVTLCIVLLTEKFCPKKPQFPVQQKRGKFRALLYDFSQAHLYVSFFYIGDRKHYTRSRRLACMYIAVTTCLAANAFSFSDGNTSWNLLKWAIASIVCNVLQAPFVGLFRWLFSATAPKYPILEDSEIVLSEVSRAFDQNQMLTQDENSEGINFEEEAQTAPPTRLSRFLDICDEIAGMIAKRFETKEVTWEALFSLFIISLFYFSICTVTLYLLPLSFTYITTLHQCILGVIAFVFFFGHLEYLYLRLRLRKYKSGALKEWRVGKSNIIMSCIMLISILLMLSFVAALTYYLPFLIPFHTPLHSYVNAACFAFAIVFVLRFVGLILSIHMPGLKRDDPEDEQEKAKRKYRFPWWMIYVNYVLCYSFVGLMIFFCLVYGVHFNARNQTWDWMMASWTGLSFYMFIRLPLTHLFMYILYGTFVKTMEASLFPEEMDFSRLVSVPEMQRVEAQTRDRSSSSSSSGESVIDTSEQQTFEQIELESENTVYERISLEVT